MNNLCSAATGNSSFSSSFAVSDYILTYYTDRNCSSEEGNAGRNEGDVDDPGFNQYFSLYDQTLSPVQEAMHDRSYDCEHWLRKKKKCSTCTWFSCDIWSKKSADLPLPKYSRAYLYTALLQ